MGNKQGIIWNQTNFPLQYCLYGEFEEIGTYQSQTTINPSVQLNAKQTQLNLIGLQHISSFSVNHKYSYSFVEVAPHSYSCVGINNIEIKKQKISVRLIIGQYVKYLIKDIVITSIYDIQLKFRQNYSMKHLSQAQIQNLTKQRSIWSSFCSQTPLQSRQQEEKQKKLSDMTSSYEIYYQNIQKQWLDRIGQCSEEEQEKKVSKQCQKKIEEKVPKQCKKKLEKKDKKNEQEPTEYI